MVGDALSTKPIAKAHKIIFFMQISFRQNTIIAMFIPQLRKSECYIDCAGRRFRISRPTGSDHDVLLAIHHVSGRSGHAGEWKFRFPQEFSGAAVESTNLFVEVGGGNDQQPSSSDNGPPEILCAGILHALGGEVRILSQRKLPKIFAGI